MGKFLGYRKARPGELFLGGKGVIIPMPLPSTLTEPTQEPSAANAPSKRAVPSKSDGKKERT